MPTVKIIQANVQHGVGTDGATNYSRQINTLTSSGIDIVCMQERSTGDTGWNAGMTSAGFTEVVYRENGHGNDGPSIWIRNSTVTLEAFYDHALSTGATGWNGQNVDKAAVAAKVTVSGETFYVVNTHLAWSAGADCEGCQTSAIREAQLQELLSWIGSTLTGGLDIVLVGDMNLAPDMPKISGGLQLDLLTADYNDLWQVGLAEGKAVANWGDRNGDGADMPLSNLGSFTHDTRRIDYGFLIKTASVLSLNTIELPDLRATCPHALSGVLCSPEVAEDQRWGNSGDSGVRPSDHNWLMITLDINSSPSICRWSTSPACQ